MPEGLSDQIVTLTLKGEISQHALAEYAYIEHVLLAIGQEIAPRQLIVEAQYLEANFAGLSLWWARCVNQNIPMGTRITYYNSPFTRAVACLRIDEYKHRASNFHLGNGQMIRSDNWDKKRRR